MSSVFSKIVNGEIQAYVVAEDAAHLAFLDVSPLVKGHVLVIPKKETAYIFDLEDNELQALHLFAKKVALRLKQAIPCKRIGMAVIGLEVPHVHIHLVPMSEIADLNFSRPKMQPSAQELGQTASLINNVI